MQDRELLELAANAAGIRLSVWEGPESCWQALDVDNDDREWNPLSDDDNALRLAVRLDIELYQGDNDGPCVCAGYWGKRDRRDVSRLYCIEPLGDDAYAATRRAIVRAAAEIGKRANTLVSGGGQPSALLGVRLRHHQRIQIMALELKTETIITDDKITIAAVVRHGPDGKWYRSEVDIVAPMTAMDLPNALRQLGDELERNLQAGAA